MSQITISSQLRKEYGYKLRPQNEAWISTIDENIRDPCENRIKVCYSGSSTSLWVSSISFISFPYPT